MHKDIFTLLLSHAYIRAINIYYPTLVKIYFKHVMCILVEFVSVPMVTNVDGAQGKGLFYSLFMNIYIKS